jgi:hypothetical protein
MNRAYAVIAGGLAIAAVLFIVILLGMPAAAQTDLVVEVAKAAIGLFPVVFFGVIVAELLKRRDDERSRRDKRREERRAFRDRAIAAYNASKSVRRYLRGAGFGPRVPPRLDAAMLAILDEQMRALSTAQLQFEQLHREAVVGPFANSGTIQELLTTIEKELNRVVGEWENGRAFLDSDPDAERLTAWTNFSAFVADKGSRVGADLTVAFKRLEEAVLAELAADPAT